jgi:hypothetical protein
MCNSLWVYSKKSQFAFIKNRHRVVKNGSHKVNSKIVPVLKYHSIMMYGGGEAQLHTFLISALDGGELLVSSTGRFTSVKKAAATHWIGKWVAPEAVWGRRRREKNLCPCQASNPVAQRCTTELTWPQCHIPNSYIIKLESCKKHKEN